MPGHDRVAVGASAGGVEALVALVRDLPHDLPAALFVVLHVLPSGTSVLPDILTRKGPLPARHARDGEPITRGHIYIAPPDHHLLIVGNRIRLSLGPSENGHRPSIDTLFRSAAYDAGPRVIGVVLSGALDDGTAGLQAIKQRSGIAIVQDPDEALFSSMPRSAVENVAVDHVLGLSAIAAALATLTRQPPGDGRSSPSSTDEATAVEVKVAGMDPAALETPRDGSPSGYTCPACHGALWEVHDGELIRFRCRVGHAYSADSLLATQSPGLEDALWIALRALEESAALARRLAERARQRGHGLAAGRFDEQVQDALHRAAIVRRALLREQRHAAAAPAEPDGPSEPCPLPEGDPLPDALNGGAH